MPYANFKPNEEVLFTRQRHEAERMGLHFDYRLVLGDKAYSWATKKEMPAPGKSIVLFEQPVHDREYALSEEVHIPTGQYGGGVTRLEFARKARIGEHATKSQFTLEAPNGDRFLFKHIPDSQWGDKAWLFRNLKSASKVEEKAREKKASMTKNKYLEKIADFISASEVSGEDWDKLDKTNPELAKKIITQGGYHGRATSYPADAIKNTNANEMLDSRNVFQAIPG